MKNIVLILFLFWSLNSCSQNNYSIIPQPNKLVSKSGEFVVDASTVIYFSIEDKILNKGVEYLREFISTTTGFFLKTVRELPKKNVIVLAIDPQIQNKEGYKLSVQTNKIEISAQSPVGVFYAIQTIRQLLPVAMSEEAKGEKWSIPNVEIEDQPRFSYRGIMLDVGRYFYPISYVKKVIDYVAMYKYNTFHLHLTEDQGWRIEIKKYPNLTEKGSWRKQSIVGHKSDKPRKYDQVSHGGFYTQSELRDLVEYAAARHITIIPEIEMPGHSQAALAAYPELGCIPDTTYEVSCNWGVHKEVYCPSEKTFRFLEDVLTEVMDIFPGKYIHIGGDECVKDRWKESEFCQDLIKKQNLKNEEELQSYFIHRIDSFVASKGRAIIGWDEILEGGLSPNATVMSWRGVEGGIKAARLGHNVIMSPNTHCYFDYYQKSNKKKEPLAIGGYLPLEKVYSYNPVAEDLTKSERAHIIGAQGNIWTEYISTSEKLEYMTFPRICALSEVVWSLQKHKDFDNFLERMEDEYKRLNKLNINYCKH